METMEHVTASAGALPDARRRLLGNILFLLFAVFVLVSDWRSAPLSVQVLKGVSGVLLGVYALGVLAWCAWRGVEVFRRSVLTGALVCLFVLSTLSFFVNGGSWYSFAGYGFEIDTLGTFFACVAIGWVSALLSTREHDLRRLIYRVCALSLAVLLLQSIAAIWWGARAYTVVGLWSEWAGFFGVVSVAGLGMVCGARSLLGRAVAWSMFGGASVALLASGNLTALWVTWACGALFVVLAAGIFFRGRDLQRTCSGFTLAALFIVCVAGALFLTTFYSTSRTLLTAHTVVESRVNLSAHMEVLRGSWGEGVNALLLGQGPHTFGFSWNIYRPISENTQLTWNRDFKQGYSLLLTRAISFGALGIIATVLVMWYLATFIVVAYRKNEENRTVWFRVTLYAMVIQMFILMALLPVGHVIMYLFVLCTGALYGVASMRHVPTPSQSSQVKRPASGIVLALGLCIIACALCVESVRVAGSSYFYTVATHALARGDATRAHDAFIKSLAWRKSDLAYRALSELYAGDAAVYARSHEPGEEGNRYLSDRVNDALANASAAVALEQRNYLNHLAEGAVALSLGTISAAQAADIGDRAYQAAIVRNPTSPIPHYLYGRFLLVIGRQTQAQLELERALELKSDYVDARELLQNTRDKTPVE